MHTGLPLSDPAWCYLYQGNVKKQRELKLSSFIWSWLQQVYSLPQDHLDIENPLSPAVHFDLRNGEYWISFRPSEKFPVEAPIFKCAFQSGFYVNWAHNSECSLTTIVEDYKKYCNDIDDCIGFINEIESISGCKLLGYSLDDDNSDCFVVKIEIETNGEKHVVTLCVDWRNPLDFPSGINLGTFLMSSESISCKIATVSEQNNSSLHSIPCKFDYTGPADIDGYFKYDADICKASLRGRGLNGKVIPMPEGFNLYILKENRKKGVSSAPKYDIISDRSNLMIWEWDKEPGQRSALLRALDFLPLAQRLACD